ncbi:hypothetical protein DOK67_0001161 [Enterococcus sp. DIV0212c]|nr:hypothetical protein A5881_001954 [Enterococcus termitis]
MFKLTMKKGSEIKAGKTFCVVDAFGYKVLCFTFK